jgi:hypothetical protein
MLSRKILAVLLVGIAVGTLGIAYYTGVLNALAGNNHHPTTTTTAQSPSLSGIYTGSQQVKEPCNSYFPCGYNQFCNPGAPCENNFIITNKGSQSIILSGYQFPDGQTGRLWQSITPGENFTLSLWDPAGYESASITLTTSSGYVDTVGIMPPQSITVSEGHGFQDNYHVSLTLIVQSNSSIPSPVTFTSYSIQDAKGNTYTNSSLDYSIMPFPPSVNVSSVGIVDGYGPYNFLGHVILYYALGFAPSSNYTITLITSGYGNFPFQLTGGMFQAVITYSIQNLIVMDSINATGSQISMHFTVLPSSISFYQVLVYDLNTVIGTYTCPTGSTSCTFSGSSWITVTLSTAVSTVYGYEIALSFSGDAPGYLVTF